MSTHTRTSFLEVEKGTDMIIFAGIEHNHGPGKAQETSLDIIAAILFVLLAYE